MKPQSTCSAHLLQISSLLAGSVQSVTARASEPKLMQPFVATGPSILEPQQDQRRQNLALLLWENWVFALCKQSWLQADWDIRIAVLKELLRRYILSNSKLSTICNCKNSTGISMGRGQTNASC